jgi:biopolymer transport protein ExbD
MKLQSGNLVRKKVEINLVPLLDSIFILIFFFMFALTTMVKKNGLSVALPKSASGKKVTEKTTLTVRQNGALFWNEEPIPESELINKLKAFKASSPDMSLIIRGDKGTPFENIVKILDQAEEIQLRRVTIETKSK